MAETGNWYAADVATFGDRLAGAREAAGLAQEDLAQRLGVRLTTVQAWEED
ncbi:MAG: helix-turn-helix domain-containing protein, partial [Paracoccaceae bacterium]